MKVALCFWGLTRSLKYTIESIKKNILQPLDDGEIEYKIFVHTFSFDSKYNNPRADERNITLDFDEYTLLNPDFIEVEDQDRVKNEINIRQYRSQPDPWESNYVSLDNFVCAMYSKRQLGIMVNHSNIDFDYVVYLRPDLHYLTPFAVNILSDNEISLKALALSISLYFVTYLIFISGFISNNESIKPSDLLDLQNTNSDYWEAYYIVGKYYYQKKYYTAALNAFEKANTKEITTIPNKEQIELYIKKLKRKLN